MKSEIENSNNSGVRIVAFISTREELDEWKRKIGLISRNEAPDKDSVNPDNNQEDENSGQTNI